MLALLYVGKHISSLPRFLINHLFHRRREINISTMSQHLLSVSHLTPISLDHRESLPLADSDSPTSLHLALEVTSPFPVFSSASITLLDSDKRPTTRDIRSPLSAKKP